MSYDWDFSAFWPYRYALLRGVWVTIEISVISTVIGTIIGVALGALFRVVPFKRTIFFLNDVLRAIPLLVLLFFFYYFPYKQIFGIFPLSAFACTILAMS